MSLDRRVPVGLPTPDRADAVPGHRRDEEAVERSVRVVMETGDLVGIEATPAGDTGDLGQERPPKREKTLHDVAQGEPERGTSPAVFGRRGPRLVELMASRLVVGRVEMGHQRPGKAAPKLPEGV